MHHEFIQKLTNIVEANLANEKFGPEELAKEADISHSNLNSKLKTISNLNASLFIRKVRLKKAKVNGRNSPREKSVYHLALVC